MTFSSPRSIAQFFDAIKWSYPTPFIITPSGDIARREDGRGLISRSGTEFWRFSATAQENNHQIAMKYQALIMAIYRSGIEVYAYDFRRPYPLLDPTGSIIGANSVQINSVGADNSSVSLKGLGATGYKLSIGDYVQVTMASGNLLLQALEDITANGSGVTAEFQVTPDLPTGIAVNNAVNLKKPAGKFIITPGSLSDGDADLITTSGLKIDFEESL